MTASVLLLLNFVYFLWDLHTEVVTHSVFHENYMPELDLNDWMQKNITCSYRNNNNISP